MLAGTFKEPASFSVFPTSDCSSVDLPDATGPLTSTNRPGSTSKFMDFMQGDGAGHSAGDSSVNSVSVAVGTQPTTLSVLSIVRTRRAVGLVCSQTLSTTDPGCSSANASAPSSAAARSTTGSFCV
eukprot:SAG31_NODE_467_length_15267_cov_13.792919_6_plen_126_part_00